LSNKTPQQIGQGDQLLAHPFTISVLRNYHAALEPLSKEFSESTKKSKTSETNAQPRKKGQRAETVARPVLTTEQEYHLEVLEYVSNLARAVERLEEIPLYLGRFPNSPTFKKRGITQHKWIQYHHSNYLVIAVGTYDTALLLTNAVFMLGLDPERCKSETVKENRWVQRTNVAAALEKLRKVTDKHRRPRHLYVHRSKVPSLGFLDTLENERFIQETSTQLDIADEPLIDPVILPDFYRLARRELVKTARMDTTEILGAIKQFFDALQPVYSSYAENLQKG
jgi:hypothetical protein